LPSGDQWPSKCGSAWFGNSRFNPGAVSSHDPQSHFAFVDACKQDLLAVGRPLEVLLEAAVGREPGGLRITARTGWVGDLDAEDKLNQGERELKKHRFRPPVVDRYPSGKRTWTWLASRSSITTDPSIDTLTPIRWWPSGSATHDTFRKSDPKTS